MTPSMGGGRSDMNSLYKNKVLRLKDYISLKMDGSAIFTAYRRKFLEKYNIRFSKYFHEDVYFMFLVYYFADNFKVLQDKIYIKNNRLDSIVNTISKRHIDGFFNAYAQIFKIIKNEKIENKYLYSFYMGIVGVNAVKLRDIYINGKNKIDLYKYLYSKIKKYNISSDLFKIKTKYFKLYESFIKIMKDHKQNKENRLQNEISEILQKSWSCYDLHNSIFLANDEIRICCKRFFINGEKKGDVVLFKIKENDKEDIFNKILESKKNLFRKINSGDANECNGCPHLEFKKWENLAPLKLEKISFEYHSICNMRCIYCSPKYFEGKNAIYDIENLVEKLIKAESFKKAKSIVWGGGEPTIEKNFDKMINNIASNINFKQMVITNSLKYSNCIQNLIDLNKIHITTSIDSNNDDTFKKIRGVYGINQVIKNLSLYSKNNPQNVTIKYIIMSDNCNKNQLEEFIKLIKQYNLTKCNFHISCDFKESSLKYELLISAITLYALLKQENIDVVFFDELFKERIFIDELLIQKIKNDLSKYNLETIIENPQNYKKICIWGCNTQTKLLLQKSIFIKNIKEIHIIDLNFKDKFEGFKISNPSKFLDDDSFILISAVQGTPRIFREFLNLGFDKNRLIKGVIL